MDLPITTILVYRDWNNLGCEGDEKSIDHNGQVGDDRQDMVPRTCMEQQRDGKDTANVQQIFTFPSQYY